MKYVELVRRFSDVPESYDDVDKQDVSARFFGAEHSGDGWDAVLQSRVVVVLGEAGSGKTTELRQQARRLRRAGRVGIFIRLESLVDGTVAEAVDDDHDSENTAAFEAWQRDPGPATFLLDSVDEVRLKGPRLFSRALSRFARVAAGAGVDISAVLSCRPNDWQYRTDLGSVRAALSGLLARTNHAATEPPAEALDDVLPDATTSVVPDSDGEDGEDSRKIRVVSLNALARGDVVALLEAEGIPDIDGLQTALDHDDAWDLAKRPRDVEWLGAFWRQNRKLGSLSALIEAGVIGMLVERNRAHRGSDPLTAERALEGGERLAAATILCRQPYIRVPDEELGDDAERPALNAVAVLSDWEDSEVKALLGRALFDEASAGRVRFHHRTAVAHLAARWLLGLVHGHGCPPANAMELFVGEAFGETWPVSDRLEMAAWVATGDAELRRGILRAVPDLLLGFGDAARIAPGERASQLEAIVAHYADGHRSEWFLSGADYRRFSAPSVTVAVVSALQGGELSDSFTRTLLWLGAEQPSAEFAEVALAIVRNPACSDSIRRTSIESVGRSGTAEQKLAMKTSVLATAAGGGLLAELTNALLPDYLTPDELADQLEKATPGDLDDSAGLGFRWVSDVVERCSPPHLLELVRRLRAIVTRSPHLRGQTHTRRISKQHGHLVPLLASCLEGLSPAAHKLDDLALEEIVQAALVCRDAEETIGAWARDYDSLAEILSRSEVLRRALLCQFVLDHFADPTAPPPWLWGHPRVVVLLADDVAWLAEKARHSDGDADRFSLLRAAVEIWRVEDQREEQRQKLLEEVEEAALPMKMHEELLSGLQPPSRLDRSSTLAPVPKSEARKRAEEARIAKSRETLAADLENLRSGSHFGGIWFLTQEMVRAPGRSSVRWAQTNFAALERTYGIDIVDAFRLGIRAFWRTYSPPLPSERTGSGGIAHGTVVGLTALSLLHSERDDWASRDPDQVPIAVRYALNEMNGLPAWLDHLAEQYPDRVGPVVWKEVLAQLDRPADAHGSQTLRNIARRPIVARTVTVPLVEHLERTDTTIASALVAETLDLVRAGEFADGARLRALSEARAKAFWEENMACALVWWGEWFRRVPADAWTFVESRISRASSDIAPAIAVRILTLVAPEGADPESLPEGLNVATLARMLPVLHRHRPTDANPGKVADVSIRWQIDNAFGVLCKKLERVASAEAHRALKALADNRDMADLRAAFASGVHRHAQNVVAGSAWTPAQVVEFARAFETEPRTPRDVQRLVVNRLLRMKADMEDGDFSERGHFQPGDPEKKYQRYTAARLRETSRIGHFVSREDEVADDKELDIRVAMPSGKTTIEIKPLDNKSANYSYRALCSTIEVQLVNQYMRDAESRFGILLLFLAEKKWFRVNGMLVGFAELISALKRYADELVERKPGVEGLTVIGIDCTPWEKAKQARIEKSPAKPNRRRRGAAK